LGGKDKNLDLIPQVFTLVPFILALKDSEAAFVERLSKKLIIFRQCVSVLIAPLFQT
jgi:hypothetical protein